MQQMARCDIIPAVSSFIHELADTVVAKKQVSESVPVKSEERLIITLSEELENFIRLTDELTEQVAEASVLTDPNEEAHYYQQFVIPKMNELRESGDKMEAQTSRKFWPYPSYTDLLFSV